MKEYIQKAKTCIKNNSAWFIGGLIALLVLVLAIVLWPKKHIVEPVVTPEPIVAPVVTETPKKTYYAKLTPKVATPRLSYMQALEAYKSSRMQLGETCHATPFKMVVKNGADIMIDNRGSQARILGFMGQKVTVAAYDYVVLKATSAQLPESILLDCGAQQNVSEILIEK